MISKRQLEANRRNALLSTGPRTAQGKAAVRLNAPRHGLRARSVLLPGENSSDLHQLCDDLESDWNPQNRTEQLLVEQMAMAQWKLARLEIGERSVFAQQMPAERQLALLDRFSAQRARLERSFSKAMRDLQHLQKTRPAETVPLADRPEAVPEEAYPTVIPPPLMPATAACAAAPLGT
jgi:hypothetical protein